MSTLEHEIALLGALIHAGGETFDAAAEHVSAADFSEPRLGQFFDLIGQGVAAGHRVDRNFCDARWVETGRLSDADLRDVLRAGAGFVGTAALSEYAKLIRAEARKRRLREACAELVARVDHDASAEPDDLTAELEARLAEVGGARGGGARTVSFEQATRAAFEEDARGRPTGFAALDRAFNGWAPGRLYIGAGRPGAGKTLFAAAAALNVARAGGSVLFFSLEMPVAEMARRLISPIIKTPYRDLERRRFKSEDVEQALDFAAAHDVEIVHAGGASVATIRSVTRRAFREADAGRRAPPALVIVDYLGRLRPTRPNMSPYEATSEISRDAKDLALELQVPVLAMAQLNRQVESRQEKRPMLADLRDSGSIEQDADAVLGLYRPAYYARAERDDEFLTGPSAVERAIARERAANSKLLEVLILKQRSGETGSVELWMDPATGEFRDWGSAA